MTKDLVDILTKIKEKITDDSDLMWTRFDTSEELRNHIDKLIDRLGHGAKDVLMDINVEFAPTSTFQEHSMQNGWSDEYMELARRFDNIYEALR